jgi:hypothetical protein
MSHIQIIFLLSDAFESRFKFRTEFRVSWNTADHQHGSLFLLVECPLLESAQCRLSFGVLTPLPDDPQSAQD